MLQYNKYVNYHCTWTVVWFPEANFSTPIFDGWQDAKEHRGRDAGHETRMFTYVLQNRFSKLKLPCKYDHSVLFHVFMTWCILISGFIWKIYFASFTTNKFCANSKFKHLGSSIDLIIDIALLLIYHDTIKD